MAGARASSICDVVAYMLSRLRAFVVARRRSLAIGAALFAAAAIAFRWIHAPIAYWAIDDAGITYAAAFQLVDHGSLAPYLEGTPIEGYSNPLLFFVIAVLRLFHAIDPI